jgi:3'(2'), 5'-bisphosphate nucleotidase
MMLDMPPKDTLMDALVAIADRAGALILRYYEGEIAVDEKADGSPVTVADHAAEQVILEGLRKLTPDVPIVAEEEMAAGRVPDTSGGRFWLVDPLDGTKEYIKRNGEFTVNIALVEDRQPVLGVVYAPAVPVLYVGAGPGTARMRRDGGNLQPIAVRRPPAEGIAVVASRSHGDNDATNDFLKGSKIIDRKAAGSSLKFGLIAEGQADIYPRFGPTMEWDTAAGHAVLLAAGGSVTTVEGDPLLYAKPDFRNPFFVARGRSD